MNKYLELDSRDKFAASRSKVSAGTRNAIPQVTEAVGKSSVGRAGAARVVQLIWASTGISNIQVRVCPAVEHIEEIRTE